MKEISFIKTQWFRLVIAVFCLVMTCIYAFKPAPEILTVEALREVMYNILIASLYFSGLIVWVVMSFIDYHHACIELLEKKAEKYDALCETVNALIEANRVDREHIDLLEQRIAQLKYDKEN